MTELVEIEAWVGEVAGHLECLPKRQRDELLADLRQHADEVAAEGGTLDEPADYAAELLRGRAQVAPSLWRRIGRRWWIAAAVVGLVLGVTGLSSVSHTEPVPAPPAVTEGG
jgi:anti-sigma factor RsiW